MPNIIIKIGLAFWASISFFFTQPSIPVESPIEAIIIPTPISTPISTPKPYSGYGEGSCLEYKDLIESYDWPVEEAMDICKGESGGNPNAVGDVDTEYVSCGLFQIRILNDRPSCYKLKNPEFNVEYAYNMWKNEGWYPWRNVAETLGLI